MDIRVGIFAALIEGVAALVAALIEVIVALIIGTFEVMFLLPEFILYLVLLFVPSSKPTGRPHRKKLSQRTRIIVRRSIYAAMALGALGALVYFLLLREPP